MSFIDKLEKVTEAKWYQVMMPKLYGWGASLVIIGALFKIEHWPFAGLFLTIGLGTEAVIFFFSAFEKTHEEPDWSLVYPELAHMNDENKRPAQQLDEALERAKIDNELVESLNEGLRSFGDSAKQLNETITAASGIADYNNQIQEGVKNMNALKLRAGIRPLCAAVNIPMAIRRYAEPTTATKRSSPFQLYSEFLSP